MAFTPPSIEELTATLAGLRAAQDAAREIINNPLSDPTAIANAQASLAESTSLIQGINEAVGGPLDSAVANAILNSPAGDIVPPNDYTTNTPNNVSANNPTFNEPQPNMTELAKENSELAKQFDNEFVGDTVNIPDTNYVPSNDFEDSFNPPAQSSSGGLQDGDWESLEYATDWNAHHGKFKFLFKVKIGGGSWQYYVKSATKPKVKMVHQDVNYYNFRTKVLTQVTFDPMTIVLWDEIGNSVNKFFATYLSTVSGQGSGNWGIDKSFDGAKSSSSSKSYRNAGYGDPTLATVVIEQIFANGTKSNRFTFKNARIESMDLDDLTMDTTEMNTLSITFNYDSLECTTVNHSVIHTDPSAAKDLLRGGGAGGPAFGANDDGRQFDPFSIGGASSPNIPGFGNLLGSAESIFANAIPSIGVGVNVNPGGVNVNLGGIVPGLGSANINIGSGGVVGNVSAGIPGVGGGNVSFGPGGVVGGISGGVPGVGGTLTFGPGGISGAGGLSNGPISVGGAFNPNSVSATAGVASTSPINVMAAVVPQIGTVIPESQHVNNINIGAGNINNLLVQPFNNIG